MFGYGSGAWIEKGYKIEHTGAGEEVCDWTSGSGHKVSGFMCSILTSLDSTFLVLENLLANVGDSGLVPGPGRSHRPWSN